MAATLELQHRSCKQDPWYFISHNLLTEDPQDPGNPYKAFPDYEYLRLIVDYIQSCPLLAVEKSRQVMVTWICAAYCLWLMLFHSGVKILVQSQKQKDADAVIDKIGVLYRSMPEWLQNRHPIKLTNSLIRTTDTRSSIEAVPQGPDVIRGPTPTLVWSDETAAQNECAETWLAIRPALSAGRGRALFTSSAAPSWFHLLTQDKLEGGLPPPPIEDPSPYALSNLPEELAAELEAEERETAGASSRNVSSWWSEQDERDAMLEDSYTSDLVTRIRAVAGDEG